MRVFITGASGLLGRATIRQMRMRGHDVAGLVRDQDRARLVLELGATPVVADIFDREEMRRAVEGCDVVMHLATAIPKKARPQRADWLPNDRLRREGTQNLIEAARGNKLQAFILQSVAFVYGDRRGEWITEDESPRPDVTTRSAVDAETMVLAAYDDFGLPGVILRGATFYSAEAWHTRALVDALKKRMSPIIGNGEQYWHYIYVQDMASACVRAAETPAPGEVFFVADDWPFHSRDLLYFLAAQLRAEAPFHMSVMLASLLAGPTAEYLSRSVRYRTDKIKKMLGWTPRYPTYREGFAEILPALGVHPK
ncbi:MAG: NAD(P)-dependent oxidoreductase [Anaerolineae bacterium]